MTVERLPTSAEWIASQPVETPETSVKPIPTNAAQAPAPEMPVVEAPVPEREQPGPELPPAEVARTEGSGPEPSTSGPESPVRGAPSLDAEQNLAGWGWRALAILLDFGIIWTVAGTATVIAHESGASQDDVGATGGLVLIAAWVLYFSVCSAALEGQTIGKRIAGIRVHRRDGEPYGGGLSLWRDSGARGLVAILPIVNLLSMAWPWWDHRNQTFHDKLGRTEVRRVIPGTPTRGILLAVLAAATVALGYGLVDVGDTSDAQLQGYPAGYTQQDKENFIEGCTDDESSVSYCECAFERISGMATHDRYLEVDRGDAEFPQAWADAAAACAA